MSERVRLTRIAAIDCGTNTIRLLIADCAMSTSERADAADGGTPILHDVLRRMGFVRLGAGIDATGCIGAAAMQRTLDAVRDYGAECAEHDVERVRFVATSASRDASNADEFIHGVEAAFAAYGISPEVVTGAAEAALSFRGATAGLVSADVAQPYLVVDLGGGSTEFVRGLHTVAAARSVDIGAVRLTERHLLADPPTTAQLAAAVADIDAAIEIADAEVDFSGIATLVGLAGTVTTVTAHALHLPLYDRSAIHGAVVPVVDVLESCASLVGADRSVRAALPFMHEGRIDVIAAGAVIWSRVVTRVAARSGIQDVRTSEADILDGIALSLADDTRA